MEIKRIANAVLEGGENPLRDVERANDEGLGPCKVGNQQKAQDMAMPDEVLNMTNDEAWNTGMGMDGEVDISTIFADSNFQDYLDDATAMDDWNVVGTEGHAQLFVL